MRVRGVTETGNIDSTQGAAIGPQAQAQNVAVNLQTRDLAIEVLERLNEMAVQIERISSKLEYVTDRTATALVGVEGRMYQMGKTVERQHAHDEQDRHTGQAEHAEQHEEVNRRLASLEELVRGASYQARADRLVALFAVVLFLGFAIGSVLGWW